MVSRRHQGDRRLEVGEVDNVAGPRRRKRRRGEEQEQGKEGCW